MHQKWLNDYGLVMQALKEAELKLKEALQECEEKKSSSSIGSSGGGGSLVGSSCGLGISGHPG